MHLNGIRFFYERTLNRHWEVLDLVKPQRRKALPVVLSSDEVRLVLGTIKNELCRAGASHVIEYLGRYIHRLPVSDRNIIASTETTVTFRYTETRTGKKRLMTLPVMEFIRRCLQHFLPPGFHSIRYYGLWSPASRPQLRQAMLLLAPIRHGLADAIVAAAETAREAHQAIAVCRCLHCQSRNVHILARFHPQEHGPP